MLVVPAVAPAPALGEASPPAAASDAKVIYRVGAPPAIVPDLATEVPTVENGGITEGGKVPPPQSAAPPAPYFLPART